MSDSNSVLLTDLYQLTMLQGYFEQEMNDIAVFEFFVRELPSNRGFLMNAGLEQVLDYLEGLSFTAQQLDFLTSTGRFSSEFINYLAELRFDGDVEAMAEGTPFFINEPTLRVIAPIAQAQLVESRIINILHCQTLIASKGARCVLAAPGKLLVDFGMRRAHGSEAALLAARATYLAGFDGTSTVLAQQRYGVPLYGTMAHSFIQAHDNEIQAFEHFAKAQPNNVVLLIDTYDTERAAEKVVALVPKLAAEGIRVKAIRLDSGDIAEHAFKVRKIFDRAGLNEIKIFSSGNMDEYVLQEYYQKQVPIDGFGVGTRLDTSADAPYLDCAYKLQEYAGTARRKRSEGKATLPGRKQVYRQYDDTGKMIGDVVGLIDESQPGEVMLKSVMKNGKRLPTVANLVQARDYANQMLQRLPEPLQQLEKFDYPVNISTTLTAMANKLDQMEH